MANVGYATLTIVPVTKGFATAIKGQTAAGMAAGGAAGAATAKGKMSSALAPAGAILAKSLKFGALAGVAGVGTALAKGFGRLRAIDQAEAKLRGLGHSAEGIEAIMGSALDSVLGTAYGLDEAATIAAGAVASGIKPGDDLTRSLKLTGDAAAIAGMDLNQMGVIFGKVAARNQLGGREMVQLAMAGIPMLQWLADEYGISAEAASDMVSAGEVDFATFQKVVEDNIGGAALAMGDSWRGAFANMGAAAGRLGAVVLKPLFERSKDWFITATGWLNRMTEAVVPLVSGADSLASAFTGAGGALEKVGNFVRGTLVPGFHSFTDWVRANVIPVLRELGDIFVTHILPVLKDAGDFFMNTLLPMFTEVAQSIWGNLKPAIDAIADAVATYFVPAFRLVAQALEAAWPVVKTIATVMANVTAVVLKVAGAIVGWLLPVLVRLVGVIVLAGAAILGGLVRALAAAFRWFADFFGVVHRVVGAVARVLLPVLRRLGAFLMGAMAASVRLVIRVFRAGVRVFQLVMATVRRVIARFTEMAAAVRSRAVAPAQRLASVLRGVLVAGFRAAIRIVGSIIGAVRRFGTAILNGVRRVAEFGRAIRQRFNEALAVVRRIPARMRAALSNIGTALRNAGRQLIGGFIGGITSRIGDAVTAVTTGVGRVVSGAMSALGMSSPSRVFADIGKMTTEGYIQGVKAGIPAAQRAMAEVVEPPKGRVAPVAPAPGAGVSALAGQDLTMEALLAEVAAVRQEIRRQTDRTAQLTRTGAIR